MLPWHLIDVLNCGNLEKASIFCGNLERYARSSFFMRLRDQQRFESVFVYSRVPGLNPVELVK
jgi:hypothetical protein